MNKRTARLLRWAPLMIVGFALFVALGGLLVRALWNWLLPPLFGFPTVTFWQALGLLLLARILFGGLGLHDHGGRRRRRMAEQCEELTPQERERFRESMGEKWVGPAAGGSAT